VSQNKYETYQLNNSELSRDGLRGQLYFKFSKNESYDIELGATAEASDSFNGLGKAPDGGEILSKNIYIQASKYFDDELKVILSFSKETLSIDINDINGFALSNGVITKHLEADINTKVFTGKIEKRFIIDKNDLFIGAQIKYQKFDIHSFKNNSVDTPMTWGPKELTIYMAYLENLYNINENNLIAISAKADHYVNDFSKSSTETILRLGYVALLDERWTFKLFGMQSYVYPTFRQTTFAPQYKVNPDLESAKSLTLTAEAIYNFDGTTIAAGCGGSQIKDAIVFSPTQKKYINQDGYSDFVRSYIRAEHQFNLDNKITLEYSKINQKKSLSPSDGALVQLFNKIYDFDIYNELVYRNSYISADGISMSAGYDYSLGIIYPYSKNLELKLKGENLLDRASEVPINGVNVPVMQRRVKLTAEYLF
jgi:iron complex outermembrane receptor protein